MINNQNLNRKKLNWQAEVKLDIFRVCEIRNTFIFLDQKMKTFLFRKFKTRMTHLGKSYIFC